MNVQIKMDSSVREIWSASTLRDPSSVNVIMDFFLMLTKNAKVGSLQWLHLFNFIKLKVKSSWKEEAWKKSGPEKNQGFNGIRTRDLRDTSAMLYQLSYEATHWERGQFIEFIFSREEWNDVKYIWTKLIT